MTAASWIGLGLFMVKKMAEQVHYEYIDGKNMIETPHCSYAEFVRRKFPEVWEKYEKICFKRQNKNLEDL